MDTSQQTTSKYSGKFLLKWVARLVGAIIVGIAYVEWKAIAEDYEFENGVMGTYRPIVLLLVYYLFWVFTRRIDGGSQNDTLQTADASGRLSAPEIAAFSLFVCIAIAFGFAAAQFAYVATIDIPTSVIVAKATSFIAFLAAAGIVVGVLHKLTAK